MIKHHKHVLKVCLSKISQKSVSFAIVIQDFSSGENMSPVWITFNRKKVFGPVWLSFCTSPLWVHYITVSHLSVWVLHFSILNGNAYMTIKTWMCVLLTFIHASHLKLSDFPEFWPISNSFPTNLSFTQFSSLEPCTYPLRQMLLSCLSCFIISQSPNISCICFFLFNSLTLL
jgi:hypothetical protein